MTSLPSVQLPIKCKVITGFDPVTAIKLTGIRLGNPIESCPGYIDAILPMGWTVVPTKGSSGSFYLVDEKERGRGFVHHMETMEAFWVIKPRFYYWWDQRIINANENAEGYIVTDFGAMRYDTPSSEWPIVFEVKHECYGDGDGHNMGNHREMDLLARQECLTWLEEQHPDWRNTGAYW